MAYFEEALRINPNQSQVLAWMAVAAGETGDYAAALEFEEKLLHIDPLYTPNLGNLASSYDIRGRTESVTSILSNLSIISPVALLDAKNSIAWRHGQLAQAILLGLDALSLEPQNSRPRIFLALQLAQLGLDSEAVLINQPVQAPTLWLLGRHDEVIAMMTEKATRAALTAEDERNLGQAYAAIGNYQEALPMLEAAWAYSGHRVSQIGPFSHLDAVALIVARRSLDSLANTSELVDALADHGRRMEEAGISAEQRSMNAALLAWFRGNGQGALFELEKAVDQPFSIIPNLHYLQDLENHPGYEAIQELRLDWLERERQAFLGVVCKDNPYEKVWQPQPGTCEDFSRDLVMLGTE
jgi:tetratricopeptide (TPR) repeat protein